MVLLTQVRRMAFGRMKYTFFIMTGRKKKITGTSTDKFTGKKKRQIHNYGFISSLKHKENN